MHCCARAAWPIVPTAPELARHALAGSAWPHLAKAGRGRHWFDERALATVQKCGIAFGVVGAGFADRGQDFASQPLLQGQGFWLVQAGEEEVQAGFAEDENLLLA